MAKILVSLVSDQTVQNVQFIKEKSANCNQFLFISTKAMERGKKTAQIIQAAQLPESKSSALIVEEFSFEQIEEALRQKIDSDNEYMVNVTGGTKIMSLAVFEFFKSTNTDCEIYYLTGQGNYIKLYPGKRKSFVLTNHLTLKEYLVAYGIKIKNPDAINHLCKPKPVVFSFFEKALTLRCTLFFGQI
jgi:hypothetical protein